MRKTTGFPFTSDLDFKSLINEHLKIRTGKELYFQTVGIDSMAGMMRAVESIPQYSVVKIFSFLIYPADGSVVLPF